MKKFCRIIISIVLLCSFALNIGAHNFLLSQNQNVIDGEETIVTEGNLTARCIYNKQTGDFLIETFENGNQIFYRRGNVNVQNAVPQEREIVTEEDHFLGYSYYQNDESAYGDYYWRLKIRDHEIPQKNFFTAVSENDPSMTNHSYAIDFKNEVDDMITAQNTAIILGTAEGVAKVVNMVGDIASHGSFSALKIALKATVIAVELVGSAADSLEDMYACAYNAYNAIMWYDFIDTSIRPES